MSTDLSRELELVNSLGLHARAAAQIATIAAQAQGSIWIARGTERADAKSTIDILSLACPQGCILTVTIENSEDFSVLEQITELIRQGFGEDD